MEKLTQPGSQIGLIVAVWMDDDSREPDRLTDRLTREAADLRRRAADLKAGLTELEQLPGDHPAWAERRREEWEIRCLVAEQNKEPLPEPHSDDPTIRDAEDQLGLARTRTTITAMLNQAELADHIVGLAGEATDRVELRNLIIDLVEKEQQ